MADDRDAVSELHRAMRYVMDAEPDQDLTRYHQECRAWLVADRKGFLMKLADLDKALLASQDRAQDGQPGEGDAPADEGEARVDQSIDRLLAEANDE